MLDNNENTQNPPVPSMMPFGFQVPETHRKSLEDFMDENDCFDVARSMTLKEIYAKLDDATISQSDLKLYSAVAIAKHLLDEQEMLAHFPPEIRNSLRENLIALAGMGSIMDEMSAENKKNLIDRSMNDIDAEAIQIGLNSLGKARYFENR